MTQFSLRDEVSKRYYNGTLKVQGECISEMKLDKEIIRKRIDIKS